MSKAAKPSDQERHKLALMRRALTDATAKVGMGGLPKSKGHKPRPVTLPKMPWDKNKDDTDA